MEILDTKNTALQISSLVDVDVVGECQFNSWKGYI